MKFITHQGDVPIYKLNKEEVKKLNFKKVKEQIVAEGEVTGHHHKVITTTPKDLIEVAEDQNGYYIKVKGEAQLTHQEHDTQALPALKEEIYYFGKQEEYDPVEYRRKVID